MAVKCLELRFGGDVWVRYPERMRFPLAFRKVYPFRGRGIIAGILFALHYLHLDRVFLHAVVQSDDRLNDVALFWPSRRRSVGRYYGYRVRDGKIVAYFKFASTAEEKIKLQRECANVKQIAEIRGRSFNVPQCKGCDVIYGDMCACFDALPEGAANVPVSTYWYERVLNACHQISQAGFMHGDFAWHNFKVVGEELWILDWEEMRKGGPKLSDEISLLFGCEYYWRKKPLKDVLMLFRRKYEGAAWPDALVAVRDLQERKITMGDILGRAFL